jgi:hypothetical protein
MENGTGLDPYAAVLADLKAKRDGIDQMIAALTAFRSGGSVNISPPSSETPDVQSSTEEVAGMYLGMSLPEAAKKLLATRKRAMTNTEIANELKQGGLVMNSVDPKNTIGSVLTRRFNDVGDIVRVDRGTWGLKDWYPGRTFKTTVRAPRNAAGHADEEQATSSQVMFDPFDLGVAPS